MRIIRKLLENKRKPMQIFMKMQLLHRPKTIWSKDEKQVALGIYYKSSGCYKFLRSIRCILPALASIQNWLKIYHLKTGVNTILINKLKK